MGSSCLDTPLVIGYSRVPEPPARRMPFICGYFLVLRCQDVRAGSCRLVHGGTIRGFLDTKRWFCEGRIQRFLLESKRVPFESCWRRWRSADRGRGGLGRG